MDNYTYFFVASSGSDNSSVLFTEQLFKGPSSITFNFDGVIQVPHPAIKLNIDWGDGSDRIYQSASIDPDSGSVVFEFDDVTHTYVPLVCAYYTALTAQVQILFSNFVVYTAVMPIKIAQTSFYKQYSELTLVNAQFVEDDIFAIMQSKTGDIYNVVLDVSDK